MNATPKERSRKSYLKNRERYLLNRKLRYQRNKPIETARNKAWADANPEKRKEIEARYRQNNRELQRQRCRDWYKKNRKYYLSRKSDWNKERRKDPRAVERDRKRTRDWIGAHPEVMRRGSQKRRALKRQATVNLAGLKQFFSKVRHLQSVNCYYCRKRISGKDCHFDHIIPLSKGGQHSATNLCVSCAECNLSKGNRTPQVWIKIGQQLLSL